MIVMMMMMAMMMAMKRKEDAKTDYVTGSISAHHSRAVKLYIKNWSTFDGQIFFA